MSAATGGRSDPGRSSAFGRRGSVATPNVQRASKPTASLPRRDLLAGAAGAVGMLAAESLVKARPAEATQGQAIIAGQDNTEIVVTKLRNTLADSGLWVEGGTPGGYGVYVKGGGSGVVSYAGPFNGIGVQGFGAGEFSGVEGTGGEPNGTGVGEPAAAQTGSVWRAWGRAPGLASWARVESQMARAYRASAGEMGASAWWVPATGPARGWLDRGERPMARVCEAMAGAPTAPACRGWRRERGPAYSASAVRTMAGVTGTGGTTNGIGVAGTGAGTGSGVQGTGGSANGSGVVGYGSGTGSRRAGDGWHHRRPRGAGGGG